MLGFLRGKPTCPVHPVAKAWVESRLEWLIGQFGPDVFLTRPVILPTRDLLPTGFDYSDDSLRLLLNRICEYMGVSPADVVLDVTRSPGSNLWLVNDAGKGVASGFGGLYQSGGLASRRGRRQNRSRPARSKISINVDELVELDGLIGTMAHELAHQRLLGEGRLQSNCFDHELTTDLTAVFHGFGIFLADSRRVCAGSYDVWPGTDLKRPEYLTPPLCGYALAHRAWLCGESKPAWSLHLGYDVRASFKQGLRYLTETGDSSLDEHRLP